MLHSLSATDTAFKAEIRVENLQQCLCYMVKGNGRSLGQALTGKSEGKMQISSSATPFYCTPFSFWQPSQDRPEPSLLRRLRVLLSASRVKQQNKNRRVAGIIIGNDCTETLDAQKNPPTDTDDNAWCSDNARNSVSTCWLEQCVISDIKRDIFFLITVQGVRKTPKVDPPSTAGHRQAAFTDF